MISNRLIILLVRPFLISNMLFHIFILNFSDIPGKRATSLTFLKTEDIQKSCVSNLAGKPMAGDKSDEHNVETSCGSKLLITQAANLLKYSMELRQ